MNSSLHIQKLLAFSHEFEEFQEVDILIESPFVNETVEGQGLRQVFLGLSPSTILIAQQRLLDYKAYPEVFRNTSNDLDIEGVELIKVLPLSKIRLKCFKPYKIVITCPHKPSLYFELCNTRLRKAAKDIVWKIWVELIYKIQNGIPLTPQPTEQTRTPMYLLYNSEEGVERHRDGVEGSSLHHLHHLTKSFDTLSRNRVAPYPSSSSLISPLPQPLQPDDIDVSSLVDDNLELSTQHTSEANVLNKNNGANTDDSADSRKVRVKSSRRAPFEINAALHSKNSISSVHIGDLDVTAARRHSVVHEGRHFVRSSSIMVKAGGKEVSALDLSKSKGHMWKGDKETVKASRRGHLNLIHNHNTSESFTSERTATSEKSKNNVKSKVKHAHKSTNEIMKEKFGSLSKVSKEKTTPSAHSETDTNQLVATELDEISMQTSDYTNTLNVISDKTEENGETRDSATQPNSEVKQEAAESVRSETIKLSAGITLPPPPIIHWSDLVNAEHHPDPPIPFHYVMFNPQTNNVLGDGYPTLLNPGYAYQGFEVIPGGVEHSTVITEVTKTPDSVEDIRPLIGRDNLLNTSHNHVQINGKSPVYQLTASPASQLSMPRTNQMSGLSSLYNESLERTPRISFREQPPAFPDSQSTSTLLREEDTDLAFPQIRHSRGMPQWIMKHLAPPTKHNISINKTEELDIQGRPAWLNQKQKSLLNQLEILNQLDDDLSFDVYDCWVKCEDETANCHLTSTKFRRIDWQQDMESLVTEFKDQMRSQLFYKQNNHRKRKRFEFLKTLLHSKPPQHSSNDLGSRTALPSIESALSDLTAQFIQLLEQRYAKSYKQVSKWSLVAATGSHFPNSIYGNTNNSANDELSQQTSAPTGSRSKSSRVWTPSIGSRKKQATRILSLKDLGPSGLFSHEPEETQSPPEQETQTLQAPPTQPTSMRFVYSSESEVVAPGTLYDSVLLHYGAEDIAREMTLIDRGLLGRLDYGEMVAGLRDCTLCAEQRLSVHHPLNAFIKLSERLHSYFICEVLRCQDVDIQIETVQHLITVCEWLAQYHNYNSLWTIVNTLQSHLIQRVANLWTDLKRRYPDKHKSWAKLVKMVEVKHYQESLHKLLKKVETKPHIPFVGLYLQKLLTCYKNISHQPAEADKKKHSGANSAEVLSVLISALQADVEAFNSPQTFYTHLIDICIQQNSLCLDALRLPSQEFVTHEERRLKERCRRELRLHQLSSIHYDFQSNISLRSHLLRAPYNCELRNYIHSLKLQPINIAN